MCNMRNIIAMAMASNLLAMASNPSNGLQPNRDGLQLVSFSSKWQSGQIPSDYGVGVRSLGKAGRYNLKLLLGQDIEEKCNIVRRKGADDASDTIAKATGVFKRIFSNMFSCLLWSKCVVAWRRLLGPGKYWGITGAVGQRSQQKATGSLNLRDLNAC